MNDFEAARNSRGNWTLGVLSPKVGAKAENLAQKEDLRALTDIVEGVRAQFERANLVHRVQFEAEFRACQDVWREANNTHREFVRLYPVAFGKPTPFQRGKFINAQQAFPDANGPWRIS